MRATVASAPRAPAFIMGLGSAVSSMGSRSISSFSRTTCSPTRVTTRAPPSPAEDNTLADGLFHLATWFLVVTAMLLIVRAWEDRELAMAWRVHFGMLAFALAIVMLWGRLVEWVDLAVLAVGYAATCLGITVGFHRLLTHRSFQTYPVVRYALAVLGTLAVEGSVLKWVADHRKHHAFADEAGDPYSPHGHGAGVLGALGGLWHPHVGWLFHSVGQADRRRYARDLLEDRGMRRIDAAEKPLILASLAFPFQLGWLVKGSLGGALVTLVWAGLARIFLLHHATFSINSICPLLRPAAVRDQRPVR